MNAERPPGPVRRRMESPPDRLTLQLPRALCESIVAHCRTVAPLEACGLLLGTRAGSSGGILEAWPARNALASPQQYEIDPEVVLAADRSARQRGQILLGAWHSHPAGVAVPSATDRDQAWPDWCYLIVGLADPAEPDLRAWRLLGEDFVEDELEIT